MVKTYIWLENDGIISGDLKKWDLKDFRKAYRHIESRIRKAQATGKHVDGAEIRLNDVIIWEYDGE